MAELFLEIYSEEIPSRMQFAAASDIKKHAAVLLKAHFSELDTEQMRSYVTPQRLVLVVPDLPFETQVIEDDIRGPRFSAPDQALQGFLKKHKATPDQCRREGEHWFFKHVQLAQKTTDLIPTILKNLIAMMTWPKSMRWTVGQTVARQTWVRPIRRIVVSYDGKPLRFSLPDLVLETTDETKGHRFLAPDFFKVTTFEAYQAALKKAYVMLDAEDRRQSIQDQIKKIETDKGVVVDLAPGLLQETSGLVAYPVCLIGEIDTAFMMLPEAVLSTSMRVHQKYFTVRTSTGKIAPFFVVVANKAPPKGNLASVMLSGYEKVLRARLSDAAFFFKNDTKNTLESRLEALKKVVFHAKLGTLSEKVDRLQALVSSKEAVRAALLCKADLMTEMVYEFPELQGVIGKHYAQKQGESPAVSAAIRAHYQPLGPMDQCPTDPVSVDLALADKIDTLAGFFAVDLPPSGSKDPFALRRCALGVIRLLRENQKEGFDLLAYIQRALYGYKEILDSIDPKAVASTVFAFIVERLKVALKAEGIRYDCVDAVVAVASGPFQYDIWSIAHRASTLNAFLKTPDGWALFQGVRRATHIILAEEKKDAQSYTPQDFQTALLQAPEERALHAQIQVVEENLEKGLKGHAYKEMMSFVATLRQPIDNFFDHIAVNATQADLRMNRLALLARVRAMILHIADFEKLEGI